MSRASNPFSTRFVRPGAIPYIFDASQNVDLLIERLAANCWVGEIIGPHGTGKSTLLQSLIPAIEARGRRVIDLRLTASQPRLKWQELLGGTWNRNTLVVIDGYEQLGAVARALLAGRRKWSGAGMLATAHASVGFPLLYATAVDEPLAIEVVEQLTRGAEQRFSRREIAQALQASEGNLREALFGLYDLYESRKEGRS